MAKPEAAVKVITKENKIFNKLAAERIAVGNESPITIKEIMDYKKKNKGEEAPTDTVEEEIKEAQEIASDLVKLDHATKNGLPGKSKFKRTDGGEVTIWGDTQKGVVIDGFALTPLAANVSRDKLKELLNDFNMYSIYWGLDDSKSYDLYRYVCGEKTFNFILTGDSFWEGTSSSMIDHIPRWYKSLTPNDDVRGHITSTTPSIIMVDARCKDCWIGGDRNSISDLKADGCAFYNASIHPETTAASKGRPWGRCNLRDLTVINSQITDSNIIGPGVIKDSSIMKSVIGLSNYIDIQGANLENCEFSSSRDSTTIQNSFIENWNVRAKDRITIRNLRRPPSFNGYVDQITALNAYDVTTIDLLDLPFKMVRKDFSTIILTLNGAASQTYKFMGEDTDKNPWEWSRDADLRTLVTKMATEADQGQTAYGNGNGVRNWESDVNRRFVDFVVNAISSRLGIITLLHDSASALTRVGAAGVNAVVDYY